MDPTSSSQRFIGQDPALNPALLDQDYRQMLPIYRENFERWLPVSRGAAVLDFGCGYGTFLRFLRETGFTNLRGVDPDQRCVEAAHANGLASVQCADNTKEFLEKNPNSFDLISALNVVTYFEREQILDYFTRLRLALKPGGHLLLELINSSSLTGSLEYIQDPYMRCRFTDVSLLDILKLSGFEVEFIGGLQLPRKGIRRFFLLRLQAAWHLILRCIYVLEHGAIERNPRIFHTRLIALAKRPLRHSD